MARTIFCAIGVLLLAAMVSGCAGNESYPNEPKPPAILTVGVFVGEDQIAISPRGFGAGPARFVITNQTGTKQTVLISTDQFDREATIGPGQTTNIRQTVEPGELTISSSNTAADTATIEVGPKRESAQQDLGQP